MRVQKKRNSDGAKGSPKGDDNREKYEQNQCIGVTRGGKNTKIHAVVDGLGYPIHLQLSSGNISDVSIALEVLSHVGQWLKGGFWPDLVGPSLALPVFPGY